MASHVPAAAHPRAAPVRRRRLTLPDLVRLLANWAVSTVILVVATAVLPDLSASSLWDLAAVAAVSGLVGLLVRPLLVEVGVALGWLTVLPLAFLAQGAVMHVAMTQVPGISSTWLDAFVVSWLCAAGGTLAAYVVSAGTDESLAVALARRGRPGRPSDPEVDGLLVVQLDGLPYPVLRWAVQAGGVPTIRRWLTSGSHRLTEWTPQLPCTTPASQLGILHGTVAGVPGFRWYDRELGRVLVANRPGDARIIEERASDGRGLLSEDGVSVSNLFSGDAPTALLTMSHADVRAGSKRTRRALAWFVLNPTGLFRSLTRTAGEVVKERWQARVQVAQGLEPRVPRTWTFAFLRALTNALQRDLNTALVSEQMLGGRKVIYVDYVDYDEIAHHAGIFRHESVAALEGLDRVLATLEGLAARAPRRYRIVVVSDHGQSQGQPFADRFGQDLRGLCAELMATEVNPDREADEGWGSARALVGDVGGDGLVGRLADSARRRVAHETGEEDGDRSSGGSTRGRDRRAGRGRGSDPAPAPSPPAAPAPRDVVVLGSGNLGLFYVPGVVRLTLDDLALRWPGLLPGLTGHPGVGFVAGIDADGEPWAYGARGRCRLTDGAVTGEDPLRPFGEPARRLLARAVLRPEAPDLYLNSTIDPDTLDIAAFEELVGAHGGLGGWQESAVLMVPQDLSDEVPERVEGADEVHRVLLALLRRCGQRLDSAPVVDGQGPGLPVRDPDDPAAGRDLGQG